MLTNLKLNQLNELVAGASREELIWLSGYMAGVVARAAEDGTKVASPVVTAPVGKITIAYGTETGNSKKLATDFAARAKKKGINARLVGLEQYRLNDLAKEEYFFTVISTQGDGEPPAAAKKFYDHLHEGGVRLERMKYGVLALGDTAYPLFCKAGEDIDQQLQKMGGQRIASLQKCDTDYEAEAGSWFDRVGTTWIFNAGNQRGPTPTRIELDLEAGRATWVSLMGTETIELGPGPLPDRASL